MVKNIPINEKKATILLKNTINFLNDNNIPYHLTQGTLLGMVREHNFIKYDNDIDISCYYTYYFIIINLLKDRLKDYNLVLMRYFKDMKGIKRKRHRDKEGWSWLLTLEDINYYKIEGKIILNNNEFIFQSKFINRIQDLNNNYHNRVYLYIRINNEDLLLRGNISNVKESFIISLTDKFLENYFKEQKIDEYQVKIRIPNCSEYLDILFTFWFPKIKQINWKKTELMIPIKSDIFLEKLYGKDWKIPCGIKKSKKSYYWGESIFLCQYMYENLLNDKENKDIIDFHYDYVDPEKIKDTENIRALVKKIKNSKKYIKNWI